MNLQGIHKKRDYQKLVVVEVLRMYLQTHACPCHWQQFEYWVGKQRPTRSQNTLQNDLVEAALRLPLYARIPPSNPAYWLEKEVQCAVCGTHWLHFSEEWHMLAYHETLLRVDGHRADQTVIEAILKDLQIRPSPTSADLPTLYLVLDQWVAFMQSGIS